MSAANYSASHSECIEFEDARSEQIHAELQANDEDGKYAKFFERLVHQPLESPFNTAASTDKFAIQSVLAVEFYSGSDRLHIRQCLLQIARRIAKEDKHKSARLEEDIHKAIGKIANGKKSSSFQRIADFVIDADSELFDSYTVKIESIGALLVRIFFLITPSLVLHNRVTKISECQTNTRVRIKYRRLQWPFGRKRPSFSVKKGNLIKRELIQELDNDIMDQVYSIVKRDIPGILASNYDGIPVLALYGGNSADSVSNNSPSEMHVPQSEFLRLVANSGVDDYDVYENPLTSEMYIEQKRMDSKKLRVLGKYITPSTGPRPFAWWKNRGPIALIRE